MPVLLVVYDAAAHTAYWLCVQVYFHQQEAPGLTLSSETVRLYFKKSERLDETALRRVAQLKNEVAAQWEGEARHELYKNYNRADGTPA